MSDFNSTEDGASGNDGPGHVACHVISMTRSMITGGVFNQTNIHRSQAPIELLQDQVAHSAFHNSAQRIDAPRCHPNTRIAVKGKAYRWIMRADIQLMNSSILWLNGPAGGGKSAIALSLAEQCYDEDLLLASIFFSRSDPSRNHTKHLVATMVYQIYQIVPSPAQRDPHIWSRDIFSQFRILVVDTLRDLTLSGFFQDLNAPRVFIIDGLDECIDRTMRQKVLELMLKALHEWRLPFLFFVTSRPEADIQAIFDRPQMVSVFHNIILDQEHLPDLDIQILLREKLYECTCTHPLRRYIPPDWPSDDDIAALVRKSSGQFIYASVIIKYVTSIRHRPHQRLATILQLRPTTESPYSELDAVYCQILSSAENLPLVKRILGLRMLFRIDVRTIESVLRLEEGEVSVALCDISSLVSLRRDENHGPELLHFHHASLQDYLFDASRSQSCHIDPLECYPKIHVDKPKAFRQSKKDVGNLCTCGS